MIQCEIMISKLMGLIIKVCTSLFPERETMIWVKMGKDKIFTYEAMTESRCSGEVEGDKERARMGCG